MIAASCY